MSLELCGYVLVREDAFARTFGIGDEAAADALEDELDDALDTLDRRHGRSDARAVLRDLVIRGTSAGTGVAGVVDRWLTARSPVGCLRDDAWSPVRSSALDDFDAALTRAGVGRNATLRRLARAPTDAAGRTILVPDALLSVLPLHSWATAENLWRPALLRMDADDARRGTALLGWWAKAVARRVSPDGTPPPALVLLLR